MDQKDSGTAVKLKWWKMILTREIARIEKSSTGRRKKNDDPRKSLWLQQIGDSIAATPESVPKGTGQTIIINIHTGQPEIISLNPKLTPQKNASLYHKKAKKMMRTESEELLMSADACIVLQKMQDALRRIKSLTPLSDPHTISESISMAADALKPILPGLTPPTFIASDSSRRALPYRHYTIDGWNIYVGKTDDQNDEISTGFAAPSDLWFHVAGHAGSHVIIRRPHGTPPPPRRVIDAAASLAAWFSKARHSPRAEVHFCESRFVHKRRGSPAGEVTLDRWESIRVTPRSPEQLIG
ncbi:MAG: DUF814 domain-containing protein [Chitinispirillaceae bacterium]|nr:DUF814 domain-containing protein [Chitinispirillaceae bacterium]